jgi:hypothetical protein
VDCERTARAADRGPVEYLSKLLGIERDTAMRWFIVLAACLLDPAALMLLPAATARDRMFRWKKVKTENTRRMTLRFDTATPAGRPDGSLGGSRSRLLRLKADIARVHWELSSRGARLFDGLFRCS